MNVTDKLYNEWAWRTKSGTPSMNNPEDKAVLDAIMSEMDAPLLNEAIDLANVLRAGKLPASADIIQSEVVGPSLGQESIEKGINSFLIALILVLIWMIFYYGRAGLYADIALVLNIVLIFGFLSGLGAVLTLPV